MNQKMTFEQWLKWATSPYRTMEQKKADYAKYLAQMDEPDDIDPVKEEEALYRAESAYDDWEMGY